MALNRRMAPDAYLGVAEVIGPDRKTMEHLVVMRRMPDERRLTACIGRGEDVDGALRAIARQLAALHDHRAPDRAHDRLGSLSSVRARWVAGFEQLADLAADGAVALPARGAHRGAGAALPDGRSPLRAPHPARPHPRQARRPAGRGHLRGGRPAAGARLPRLLRRVPLGRRARRRRLPGHGPRAPGPPGPGRALLALHREFGADTWPPSLAHHYVAYRAHVRP
ncbi:MAG: hypothetical protein R2711_05765 [Acidimicrobiales bacterium]